MKNWITEGVASDAKDKSKKTLHTVILQSWISKNFAFQAWNPNWKDFLKYFESYLGKSQFSTLTDLNSGFGVEKLPNWHFLIHAWNSKNILLHNMMMTFSKNIANMSQDLPNPGFRSVKVENWDFLKKESQTLKNSLQFGFLWIPT